MVWLPVLLSLASAYSSTNHQKAQRTVVLAHEEALEVLHPEGHQEHPRGGAHVGGVQGAVVRCGVL